MLKLIGEIRGVTQFSGENAKGKWAINQVVVEDTDLVSYELMLNEKQMNAGIGSALAKMKGQVAEFSVRVGVYRNAPSFALVGESVPKVVAK